MEKTKEELLKELSKKELEKQSEIAKKIETILKEENYRLEVIHTIKLVKNA